MVNLAIPHPIRVTRNFRFLFSFARDIRVEIASLLDIDSAQQVLASHWKPYLKNLHVCMTDATCYESYMRYPTNVKLLWESVRWLHTRLSDFCAILPQRLPQSQQLMKTRVKAIGADGIYANNANRRFRTKYNIHTSFVRKGKPAKDEKDRTMLRKELSRERATRMEGSFGTQKQHYDLLKVHARRKQTEILWIFFGIHTAKCRKND